MSKGRLNSKDTRKLREICSNTQGHFCCYCEQKVTSEYRKTLEHLMLRCKGGTYSLDNLAMACHDCNQNRPKELYWMLWKSVCLGEITLEQALSWNDPLP